MSNAKNTLVLDTQRWDIVLDVNGNIAMASAPYSLAQDVASTVKLFLGEAWWDTTQGIPYWSQILGKQLVKEYYRAQIINVALTVPGVLSVKVYFTSFLRRQITGQIQITDTNSKTSIVSF